MKKKQIFCATVRFKLTSRKALFLGFWSGTPHTMYKSPVFLIFQVWSYKSFFLKFWLSGAKLCMILDLLDLLGDSGSVTGVDVARHRLAACRTMLQKYTLGDRCRLFVADGTTFSLIPVGPNSDYKPCNWTFNCDKVSHSQIG